MKLFKKIKIKSTDIWGLLGLGGVFYGLYMREPWLAFTIVGAVLFLLSILDFEGEEKGG